MIHNIFHNTSRGEEKGKGKEIQANPKSYTFVINVARCNNNFDSNTQHKLLLSDKVVQNEGQE